MEGGSREGIKKEIRATSKADYERIEVVLKLKHSIVVLVISIGYFFS